MRYSILAIDLDGTLLNDEKEIDERNWEAIQSFRANGGHVIITSGRTPCSTQWISECLKLTEPIIAFNGAVTQQSNGTRIRATRFDLADILLFIELCQRHGVYFHLYSGDALLVPYETRWNRKWVDQNIPKLRYSGGSEERYQLYRNRCHVIQIEAMYEYIKEEQPDIEKIAVFHETNSLLQFSNLLNEQIPNFEISSSLNYSNLEISPYGVTKGSSLTQLVQDLGYPLQQVAAIGDNFNDIAMLEAVGFGIAMGNAPDGVKARAAAVTSTNRDAGVAKAIFEFLLN